MAPLRWWMGARNSPSLHPHPHLGKSLGCRTPRVPRQGSSLGQGSPAQPYLVEGGLQQPVLPEQQGARGLLVQQRGALLWLEQHPPWVQLLLGAQVEDEGEHGPQTHHDEGQVLVRQWG